MRSLLDGNLVEVALVVLVNVLAPVDGSELEEAELVLGGIAAEGRGPALLGSRVDRGEGLGRQGLSIRLARERV